jgi:hypothetical protein
VSLTKDQIAEEWKKIKFGLTIDGQYAAGGVGTALSFFHERLLQLEEEPPMGMNALRNEAKSRGVNTWGLSRVQILDELNKLELQEV